MTTHEDKAQMFAFFWAVHAPDMPRLTPEYEFARSVHYRDKNGHDRTRKYRADWASVPARVLVEVDGGQYSVHGGRHATDADRDKLNTAASLRYLVFRFSPQQLTSDPARCVELVKKAILDSQ